MVRVFNNKVFLVKVGIFLRHNAVDFIDVSVVETQLLYELGSQKIHFLRYLLYCGGLELNPQNLQGIPMFADSLI